MTMISASPSPAPLSPIARLNDALRHDMAAIGHDRVVMTATVVAIIGDIRRFRGFHRRKALLRAVRDYDAVRPEVDPYGEHDFAASRCSAKSSSGRSIIMIGR